jgi:NAD(P)-dependent dehydrogenase (short-subunit alcohol dehydrogenase family)
MKRLGARLGRMRRSRQVVDAYLLRKRDMGGQFRGEVALITGGTRGLGGAAARCFAEQGAFVAIVCRDEMAAKQFMASSRASPGVAFYKADVRRTDAATELISRVTDRFGRLDILINSAGGSKLVSFLETDPATPEAMLAANLKDTVLFAQAAANTMIKEGRSGRIIDMSSVSGQRGSTLRAAYGMAKSAIIQLTKVMAVELVPYGIRVNAIAPGPIETRAAIERHRPTGRGANLRTISMRRNGTPKEVAAAAMYLASEAASCVTGHISNVDGGFCAAGILQQELTACASVP